MKRNIVVVGLLPLLAALALARPAAACGTSPLLELGVRDLNDQPVARVAFAIEVDGAPQQLVTDAGGLAELDCATASTVRFVAARSATGGPLAMDENTAGGGLTIPLTEGQTVRLPFRLTDTILFVEPVAEGERSTVFSAAPVAALGAAATGGNAPPAPAAAITPPIPSPSRPAWFWWAVALVIGVPAALGLLLWLRTSRRWVR